ncbi:MAG: serine/threonine-protein kinase [Pyrinomonadaceae bacterium]|nr:serine/threonine-protein kinase [Pyrinomonadaceae bacterium]
MLSGKKIGRYEIRQKIGAGGMGEVYLAHDESLDRNVAVKVLLPEFCCNLERVNRFKLEARAASALNHPNIITIYEIGTCDEELYIATENIKGETLRSLIERNAVSFVSSLQIAEQILSGLTAAHQAGIIHRDLKPENVMVREDGIVKILDFGLAKPTLVESEAETRELVSTKAGMVMGSVSYMSPEQSRGKETDARTDLWSVGIVLYEMLTGKTPFEGETVTDTLANIIHKEPVKITEIIEDAPTELHRILKKSLRKDREERYQSAKDFLLDLKNLRRELEIEHELEVSVSPNRVSGMRSRSGEKNTRNSLLKPTNEVAETQMLSRQIDTDAHSGISNKQNPKKRYSMLLLAIFGLLLLGTLSVLSFYLWQKPDLFNSFERNISVSTISRINDAQTIEISPDGKYLAYVKNGLSSDSKLMLRQIETGSEKEIIPLAQNHIGVLKFSPDANYLYFTRQAKGELGFILFRVPTLGGEAKQIAFDVDSGVSFRADGKSLIFHRHILNPSMDKIIEINAEGGEEKEIYSSEKMLLNPQLSPDGKTIVAMSADRSIQLGKPSSFLAVVPQNGGELRQVGKYWGFAGNFSWLKDGSGLVVAGVYENEEDPKLYLVNFPSGEAKPLIKDANSYFGASLTADSKTIATIQSSSVAGIWEFETATGKSRQISPNDKDKLGTEGLAVLPNGKILYVKSVSKEEAEIWEMDVEAKVSKRLTAPNSGRNAYPVVSADGNFIYYESFKNGVYDIWRMNADGTNPLQITKTPDVVETITSLTPDGKSIVFSERDRSNGIPSIRQINVETGEINSILQDDKQYPEGGRLSPDGKNLLFITAPINFDSGVMPQAGLFIAPFDGKNLGTPKQVLKTLNSNQYRWSPDGKSILFTELSGGNADIWSLNLADGKKTKVTNFNLEVIARFSVSPDGKKIYLVRRSTTQDIILIKSSAQ